MSLIYSTFKKLAFSIDPEIIHENSLYLLSRAPLISEFFEKGSLGNQYKVSLNGPSWTFPVGLAAGLDKNAQAFDFFSRLDFGAIEVGTVTPKAQDGNPRPRLFRYVEEESLRNKMGFNNLGADQVYSNIFGRPRNGKVLGVNLGKNKTTDLSKAWEDYVFLYKKFSTLADYLVINVSSPNTPGLRGLQESDALKEILESLECHRKSSPCPLYLKISPDIDPTHVSPIVELAKMFKLTGIIATNTTIRPDLGDGGVSGKLCLEKSKKVREWLLKETKECPDLDIIGVGGISSFEDLRDFWKAGGRAVQIYTSFIFQGPSILFEIKLEIDRVLKHNNLKSVDELLNNVEKVHFAR